MEEVLSVALEPLRKVARRMALSPWALNPPSQAESVNGRLPASIGAANEETSIVCESVDGVSFPPAKKLAPRSGGLSLAPGLPDAVYGHRLG